MALTDDHFDDPMFHDLMEDNSGSNIKKRSEFYIYYDATIKCCGKIASADISLDANSGY